MQSVEVDFGPIVGKRCIAIEDDAFADTLAHLYGAEASGEPGAGSESAVFQKLIGSSERGFSLGDQEPLDRAFALGALDYRFDLEIRAHKTARLCTVHSCGLMAPSGGALAVLGQSGSGKTTLGLACAMAGFGYMGDEFGFLDLESGNYSHTRYPLCVRRAAWNVLGLKRPKKAVPFVSPLGNEADMVALEDVLGRDTYRREPAPLAAIVVPYRVANAAPTLQMLSVTEWVEALMPSLDANLSRDVLFRKLVSLVALNGVKVFAAEYSHIEDGIELVKRAGECASG